MISRNRLPIEYEEAGVTALVFARLVFTSAFEVGRVELAQMLGVTVEWVSDWIKAHEYWRAGGKGVIPGISSSWEIWPTGWRAYYDLMQCEQRVRDEEAKKRGPGT